MSTLPPLLPFEQIQARLLQIFPEGSPNRANCVWEISTSTVFVMLYIGAIEGDGLWLRPDQILRMTDAQSELVDNVSRTNWEQESRKNSKGEIAGRWYAVGTREPVRDDTIRNALIPNGAVIERTGLATTSPAPRYALRKSFAQLFDPALDTEELQSAISRWRDEYLSKGAIARIAIRRQGAVANMDQVLVRFPNGETQNMAPGVSSKIAKALIEQFVPHFLTEPGVIWLSESRKKVVSRHDELARSIGLVIRPDRNLPDAILVDLAPLHPLLIFVEIVATDGPISAERKAALADLAAEAKFPFEHVAFVTAYLDRSEPAFKKTVDRIAWGTFVWFAAEPENLIRLHCGGGEHVARLSDWPQ